MKLCLVTVGATAPFEKLIRQVLSEPFLASLKQHNYTHLLVQYGKDGKPIMDEFLEKNPEECESLHGIGIGGFDFTQNMIPSIIMTVHNPAKEQEQGLMISHGGESCRFPTFARLNLITDYLVGTGSILEGLRAGVTLVVVPNTDLAGNHQEQLAIQLDKTGYAVHSSAE